MQERREIDGHNGFHWTYNKEDNSLMLMFYQNNSMKKVYAEYGELLIVDAKNCFNPSEIIIQDESVVIFINDPRKCEQTKRLKFHNI